MDVSQEVFPESEELKEARKEVSKSIGVMAEAIIKLDELKKEHEEIKRNAELGDRISQFRLGTEYSGKDDAKAFIWWYLSAEQGYPRAQVCLGNWYSVGRFVNKNEAEAMKWYQKAADQGHADGQFHVGAFNDDGRCVARDDVEAAKWYKLAAEQGHARAQYHLAEMLDNGEGIPEDDVMAYMWAIIAAADGHTFAAQLKKEIEKQITPVQIAEAQKLSREWVEKNKKEIEN